MLSFGAAVFYLDMFTDVCSFLILLFEEEWGYALWVFLAMFATFMRAKHSPYSPNTEIFAFLLAPARLARRGFKMKPSAAAGKEEWTNNELKLSSERMEKLSKLRSELWGVTRVQAEIQAPTTSKRFVFVPLRSVTAATHLGPPSEPVLSSVSW